MIRVLLATGRPALDAAIAADPDLDIVAQAYYTDAAVTALTELRPDVAVIDPTLPGTVAADWVGGDGGSPTKMVWLRHPGGMTAGEEPGTPAVAGRAAPDPRAIVSAIRSAVTGGDDPSPVVSAFRGGGIQAFVGCLPRLGVTTAAAMLATHAARAHERVAIVDANLPHPCLPEVMGFTQPEAGWDTTGSAEDLASIAVRAHGVCCLALSREAVAALDVASAYGRMKWIVPALYERGNSIVVVDCGSPRPLQGGRLAPWLEWLSSLGSLAMTVNLLVAQDPQALLAAARVLRAAEAAGVAMRVWCASYDEQISSISEIAAALGHPCGLLPWDRQAVLRCALAGKPPALGLALSGRGVPLAALPRS